MTNHMTIVQHGRVSVLVFDSAEQRADIGRLLADAPEHVTRIAVSPEDASDEERTAALQESVRLYPLPSEPSSPTP